MTWSTYTFIFRPAAVGPVWVAAGRPWPEAGREGLSTRRWPAGFFRSTVISSTTAAATLSLVVGTRSSNARSRPSLPKEGQYVFSGVLADAASTSCWRSKGRALIASSGHCGLLEASAGWSPDGAGLSRR